MELQLLLLLVVVSLIIVFKDTILFTINDAISYFLNAATQNDYHVQYSIYNCFWNYTPISVMKQKGE